jgi:hypothetical protein
MQHLKPSLEFREGCVLLGLSLSYFLISLTNRTDGNIWTWGIQCQTKSISLQLLLTSNQTLNSPACTHQPEFYILRARRDI